MFLQVKIGGVLA